MPPSGPCACPRFPTLHVVVRAEPRASSGTRTRTVDRSTRSVDGKLLFVVLHFRELGIDPVVGRAGGSLLRGARLRAGMLAGLRRGEQRLAGFLEPGDTRLDRGLVVALHDL